MKKRSVALVFAATLAALLLGACDDDDNTTSLGDNGRLIVRLTDSPALIDSIQRVDIFVVRVDGRLAVASDAEVAANVDNGGGGWVTLATPNATFDLVALRNGNITLIGDTELPVGTYQAFRVVIDPSKTTVTLKNGRVLTRSSSPGIAFPNLNRIAIRVLPSRPVEIVGGRTNNLIVDFDINQRFVQRGVSIGRDGLVFRPVITATVVDPGVVTAKVRLVNLTRSPITLWQAGDPVDDARKLQDNRGSGCFVVNTLDPLNVTEGGSAYSIGRFAPVLVPGESYVLVVFGDTLDGLRVVTLPTRFVVPPGRSGLRVFNISGLVDALDITVAGVTASSLGPVTFSDIRGESISAFVDVAPGFQRIILSRHGSSEALLDIPSLDLLEGQRLTLVILPPVRGLTVPRFFVVPAC